MAASHIQIPGQQFAGFDVVQPAVDDASANEAGCRARVLLVAASPRYVGGQAVMAQRLITDLRRDGVTVDFQPVDPELPAPLRPLDRVKYVRTLLRSIFYLAGLLRQVPRHDVVHVFSASYSAFLVSTAPALLTGRLFGKRTILNYHSGEADDHLANAGTWTKKILSSAHCIVVPSGYLVSVFARHGFTATAITNHVEAETIIFRERREIRPHIIVARTLDELYNIPCALRAFALFQREYPDAELTILGDGPRKHLLQNLADSLKLRNVTFHGFASRSEIPRLYDAADLFLNTSSIDNMPVSILEAFAAGLPIVTTDAGGIPYIIRDRVNGHLVPVDDHQAAADRLLELMKDPDQVLRLSQAGRAAAARYSWKSVGQQWMALYDARSQPAEAEDSPRGGAS